MSTALAIASVSVVLVDLLNNGLIDHDIGSSIGGVTVSALPPDRIDTSSANQQSQLNLFLYRVTPNTGWVNLGLPARNAGGDRVGSPPLALDLHYLLSAYGTDDFHSEILLGHGMQILHETPVLAREAIRSSLRLQTPPSMAVDGRGLPQQLRALATSELAEQMEQIKISPEPLSTEEISKLWAAFQSSYRPTAAYLATVVLIESDRPAQTALPVGHRIVRAVPLGRPVIERLLSGAAGDTEDRSGQPILPDSLLVLEGNDLRGEETQVLLGGRPAAAAPNEVQPDRIRVPIPSDLPAGIQSVQVRHGLALGSPPTSHWGVESNLEAFVLRPRIDDVQILGPQSGADGRVSADVELSVTPEIGADQRVVLILNETHPPSGPTAHSYQFPRVSRRLLSPPLSSPAAANRIRIPVTGVEPGTYLFRVEVDGALSQLDRDAAGVYSSPVAVIA